MEIFAERDSTFQKNNNIVMKNGKELSWMGRSMASSFINMRKTTSLVKVKSKMVEDSENRHFQFHVLEWVIRLLVEGVIHL